MEWLIGLALVGGVGYYFWSRSKSPVDDEMDDIQ
jgi:hypothetical protein